MEADNKHPQSEQPELRHRTEEKVIQPLDANLSPAEAVPRLAPTPSTDTATANFYDPTNDTHYRAPTLDLRKSAESISIKRVAVKHKSLMVLAIAGLLSTVFAVYVSVHIGHKIQQMTNASQANAERVALDFIYVGIAFNTLVYVYLLLAKNPHTVATILKVLLVLDFISVFGIFWGGSAPKTISLLIDGVTLLYTYIVLNIVKTRPTI